MVGAHHEEIQRTHFTARQIVSGTSVNPFLVMFSLTNAGDLSSRAASIVETVNLLSPKDKVSSLASLCISGGSVVKPFEDMCRVRRCFRVHMSGLKAFMLLWLECGLSFPE